MEVVQETFDLLVQITLKISFGFDIDEEILPFVEGGKVVKHEKFG